MKPSFVVLFLCLLTACESSSAGPNPDVCSLGDAESVRMSTPAEGGGWCCPGEVAFSPSYGGRTGGWASDFCDCGLRDLQDAPPCAYHEYVDDHGCRGYSIRFDEGCGTIPTVDASVPDASSSDAAAAPDAGE